MSSAAMDIEKGLEAEIEEARKAFRRGTTRDASWRKLQLKRLLALLSENEALIFKALKDDLGKHRVESYRDEVGTLIKSIDFSLSGIKRWMASERVKLPIAAFPSTGELVCEPLGIVLIISSWNFPMALSLEPLIGAIAAGNTVVIKPSELSPNCSSLLANIIPKYLDSKAIKVITGGSDIGERLLLQKWDKIFFTGSARVGSIVMRAASKHLTPVTLELGGKCAAVIDTLSCSWDKQMAAKRLVMGKFGVCAGQVCVGIDYMLVEEQFVNTLVELLKDNIKRFGGKNPREQFSSIVNRHHFLRLKDLLNETNVRDCVVHGGSLDEDNLFVEPTILVNPPLNSSIMKDEIFGPLLPIITLKKIDDCVDFINSRPKALALYAFTKNEKFKKKIVSETSSGSVTFNDAIIQYLVDTLPFGGVGESGFGNYHGKFSFECFSHKKAVLKRSFLTDFWFGYPPWNNHKLTLLRSAYKYDYLGILLILLGLKRS